VSTSALKGIRVLDLSSFLAGPSCGQLMSDFGAEVIKVESTSGDEMRQWSPVVDGESITFMAANRGKRALALNLKTEKGRQILYELVRQSDVVLHNFLPKVANRLGVDWEIIKDLNPRIVMCSISGYGSQGALANKPGFDLMVQAFSGLMSVTGDPDGPPKRLGASLLDITTGVFAFSAIVTALLARAEGRCESQHVEVSLLATSVHLLNYHITSYLNASKQPRREGSGVGHLVPYQSFEASDGFVLAGATNDEVFKRFCRVLGVPDLALDPRFVTGADRVKNRAPLIEILDSLFPQHSVDHWISSFEQEGIPCSPVQTVEQLVKHPQIEEMNLLLPEKSHVGKDLQLLGIPIRMNGTPGKPGCRPPRLGENSAEVLREILGYDDIALEQLRKEAVI
jgi:crotonobetainyl-CoA:carnitine CoA-transferase CaiB-like acyl-CoA transferase